MSSIDSVSPRQLGGPIFIGQVSGQVARAGGAALLSFMALLSVNLAIINLLPIPVLDGGHLVLLLVEKVKGSPVNPRIYEKLLLVGFVLIILLMVFVTYNDIRRLL